MDFLILGGILILTTIIGVEDFKSYQIRLVWLVMFFGFSQVVFIYNGKIEHLILNSLFIILLFFGVCFYAFLKKTKLQEVIGLGDLFFFVSMCFLMDSFWLIRITLLSLCFGLIIHHFLLKKKDLPLVGYLSVFYTMFLCLDFYLYKNYYLIS